MNFFLPFFVLMISAIKTSNSSPSKITKNFIPPEEKADFYEGDILLLPSVTSRNGLSDEAMRWPKKTLPFTISTDYEPYQREKIFKAVSMMNNISCLLIRPRQPQDTHYVHIADRNKGCSSFIGFLGIGEQEMNLATACFTKIGTIMHEFLHAAGFVHQHSASDRDDFIKILWENVDDKYKGNFMKFEESQVTDFQISYDHGSVMHYSPFAFSKNGKETIVAIDKQKKTNSDGLRQKEDNFKINIWNSNKMGQRDQLSSKDIKKLNRMYECPNKYEQ